MRQENDRSKYKMPQIRILDVAMKAALLSTSNASGSITIGGEDPMEEEDI